MGKKFYLAVIAFESNFQHPSFAFCGKKNLFLASPWNTIRIHYGSLFSFVQTQYISRIENYLFSFCRRILKIYVFSTVELNKHRFIILWNIFQIEIHGFNKIYGRTIQLKLRCFFFFVSLTLKSIKR